MNVVVCRRYFYFIHLIIILLFALYKIALEIIYIFIYY